MKSHNRGPVRWGILGTAQIGRKNWKAILNSGNAVLGAVASRDLQRSRQFVRECQSWAPFLDMPAALGSYEELLRSDDIEAVSSCFRPGSVSNGSYARRRPASMSCARNPAPERPPTSAK